jgi:hypothetical protein
LNGTCGAEESFRFGHHVDTTQVGLEVYRLATMFLSSEQIADFSLGGQRTGKGMVDYDTHWLEELSLKFFWGETSRILVYTAIQGRLLRSIPHCKSLPIWDEACGDIETGMIVAPESFGAGPLSGSIKPLTLKQAFDKIIHSLAINPDVEPLTEFGSFGPTKTNPILFLYGKHWNEKPWRATLSVLEYVRLMRRILVAVGA